MIAFSCTACPATFSLKEEYAGRKIKCPKCDTALRVPSPNGHAGLTSVPASAVPVQSSPPSAPPSKGLWGRFADKAKRSLADAQKSVQDVGRKLVGQSSGELYQSHPEHRELSKVVSHPHSVETYPWPPGSTLRLILSPDEFLFVECPLFGPATVPLRLPHSNLLLVRTEWIAVADIGQALLDGLRYSEKELRMLHAVEKPGEVKSLCLMYHDETKYDKHRLFIGLESGSEGMPLDESAYHLSQLINARKAQVQQASRQAGDEQVEQLQGIAAKATEQRAKLLQIRDQSEERKTAAARRVVELQEKIARIKAAKAAATPESRVCPSGTDILAQIEQLGQLRDKGMLTEQEFQAKKQELLARL